MTQVEINYSSITVAFRVRIFSGLNLNLNFKINFGTRTNFPTPYLPEDAVILPIIYKT